MSTLAAARADNFYLSKNYDPSKVKPKKSDTAEQVPFKVVEGQRVGGSKVRYQTPFHVRCMGCQNMVAKGVRFNAIKTWTDNFHSTKIYEFRMKCPVCPMRFVVRTDPQNCDYVYVSGARRIFQAADCTDDSRIRDEEELQKKMNDPFARLQKKHEDKEQYLDQEQVIERLYTQQQRGKEDFELNRMLRKQIKGKREAAKQYFSEKQEKNLLIPLLEANAEDQIEASSIQFKANKIKKIVKQQKTHKLTQRDILKEKMKKMHPSFVKKLKAEIKVMNTPKQSSVFIKK